MQGYESREAVLDILLGHEATGAFLKDLFPRFTENLSRQDRGLAREIALGVIRNLSLLDYNIGLYAAKKPGPGPLRTILRLTAYQLFFMDVPAFAAVNVGVELAKIRVGRHQGGFTNALLKKMLAAGLQKAAGGKLAALAVNHSHPEWLLRRWYRRLGGDGMIRALERNNQEAPLWLRINPSRIGTEEARRELAGLGAETDPDPAAPLFLRLTGKGGAEAVLNSDLFAQGKTAFQDPAAWFIAELAGWRSGASLLDLCAAPGGKSACMVERASYLGDSGAESAPVVCNDISFRRLRRIHDPIGRQGHARLLPLVMDPAHRALRAGFDIVVVDAPCSNLGVIRRRPEARWNRGPGDLARLAVMQRGLLDQAAALANPRGRIVYATCSPEEEETREVVEAFLASHPEWKKEDASAILPAWAVKEGYLWLFPGETDYDGFFAAVLVRADGSPA